MWHCTVRSRFGENIIAYLCSSEAVSGPAPTPTAAADAVTHPVIFAPNAAVVIAAVFFLFLGGCLGSNLETFSKAFSGGAGGRETRVMPTSFRETWGGFHHHGENISRAEERLTAIGNRYEIWYHTLVSH